MVDNQIITEPHHRRCRSLNGSSKKSNLSYVKKDDHIAWHKLYANLNAYQTCQKFQEDLEKFEKIRCILVCKFINGDEVTKKGRGGAHNSETRKKAWMFLFGNKSLKEKIAYVNYIWLDPSYHIYLAKKLKLHSQPRKSSKAKTRVRRS